MLKHYFTVIGCCLFALIVFSGFAFVLKIESFCRNDVIYIYIYIYLLGTLVVWTTRNEPWGFGRCKLM